MTSRIPLVDLRAQIASIRGELDAAIAGVLDRAELIGGAAVRELEERFAERCGTRHAIGTASGTAALHVALLAAGIGPGDEVLVPAFSFAATAEAVVHAGARPVFVDVEPGTLCMAAEAAARAIGPKTRAIVPVHLYGQAADMEALGRLADDAGLTLIEDAAQAFLTPLGRGMAGSQGRFGCFSLYPSKNLGAYGDGGVLTCQHDEDAARARLLIDHGRTDKHRHRMVGYNYRLDALQAALVTVKLRHIDRWTAERRRLAERYDAELAELPPQALERRRGHAHHLYVVRAPSRAELRTALGERGIATAVHYPRPLHHQPAFAAYRPRAALPVCERAAKEVLTLPLYPELGDERQDRIVEAIRAFYAR